MAACCWPLLLQNVLAKATTILEWLLDIQGQLLTGMQGDTMHVHAWPSGNVGVHRAVHCCIAFGPADE